MTISDLATEWHWHRATVRSFLETLETFGQLKRIQARKEHSRHHAHAIRSVFDRIRCTATAGLCHTTARGIVRLDSWQNDHCGCRQPMRSGRPSGDDRNDRIRDAVTVRTVISTRHRHTPVNRKMRFVRPPWDVLPTLPCNEYCANRDSMTARRSLSSFVLTSMKNGSLSSRHPKSLSELILDTEASETTFDTDDDKERLKSLRKPFLSLLAKDTGGGGLNREPETDCITRTIRLHPLTVILPVIGGTRACPSATKQREGGA